MILTGAGQIGMAVARRMGYGMKIVIGDKKPENAQAISQIMNQAGFDTAVAACGTALTPDQVRLLGEYADEVVLCYDSDEAGQKATARSLGLFAESPVKVSVLNIPGAKDPDEFIKKYGRERFESLLNGTSNAIEYKLAKVREKYDLARPADRVEYIKEAIRLGVDPILAIKVACHHAARYFLLNNRGAIAPGYLADFVIIDNFQDFRIEKVYKKGALMFDGREVADFPAPEVDPYLVKRSRDTFHVAHLTAQDFAEHRPRGIIGMVPGEIVTEDQGYSDHIDVEWDILKAAVVERHKNTRHIGIGYLQGYGLKSGAVATSVSHDSHNIIVVGTNEEDMAAAVNRVVENRGGIVVMDRGEVKAELALPIAGIMSDDTLENVNEALERAKEAAFALGVSRGIDPFMTLSFMALPVIPTLRLTTRGVIDVAKQQYI